VNTCTGSLSCLASYICGGLDIYRDMHTLWQVVGVILRLRANSKNKNQTYITYEKSLIAIFITIASESEDTCSSSAVNLNADIRRLALSGVRRVSNNE
jgi:hypothetical protein